MASMTTLCEFLELLGKQFQSTCGNLLVLRNYKGLPYVNKARDLDILIGEASMLQRIADVNKICENIGISFQIVEQHIEHLHIIIFNIEGRNIDIDLIPAFVWYGIEWLNADEVFRDAQLHSRMIWIPCPAHECVITFCHSFLYGGHVKKKYAAHLATLASNQPEKTSECLDRIFGKRIGKIVMKSMLTQQWDLIIRFNKLIRIYVLLKEFAGHPLIFTKTLIRFFTYAPLPGVKTKFSHMLRSH